MKLGGTPLSIQTFCFCSAGCQNTGGICDGVDMCGGGWAQEVDTHVSGTIAGTSDSVVVAASSTLDQAANDESWGIDNIFIYVR